MVERYSDKVEVDGPIPSVPTMIRIICDICGKRLNEFGGLIFSPPNKKGFAKKWHLCRDCYKKVEKLFENKIVPDN